MRGNLGPPVALVLLTVAALPLLGLDVGASFTVSNLNFHADHQPADEDFSPGFHPFGINVFASHRFDDILRVDAGFTYDRILRSSLYGRFAYTGEFFTVGVGPYLGLFNTAGLPVKPGISAEVRFDFPGFLFLELHSDRTINLLDMFVGGGISGILEDDGDYNQESSGVELGWYIRNSLLSLAVSSRSFVRNRRGDLEADGSTDYAVKADIFQKNTPVKILLSFIYRTLSKTFDDGDDRVRHTVGSLLLGSRVDILLTPRSSIYAGLESSIYSFGLDGLLGEFSSSTYLFSLTTGFILNVDNLIFRQ